MFGRAAVALLVFFVFGFSIAFLHCPPCLYIWRRLAMREGKSKLFCQVCSLRVCCLGVIMHLVWLNFYRHGFEWIDRFNEVAGTHVPVMIWCVTFFYGPAPIESTLIMK